MAPSNLQHRRTHNLLLVSKLLSQRDAASPFTLVLDTLEQSARPLLAEYARRAKVRPIKLLEPHASSIDIYIARKTTSGLRIIRNTSEALQCGHLDPSLEPKRTNMAEAGGNSH